MQSNGPLQTSTWQGIRRGKDEDPTAGAGLYTSPWA